jgi:hypothetical protein
MDGKRFIAGGVMVFVTRDGVAWFGTCSLDPLVIQFSLVV